MKPRVMIAKTAKDKHVSYLSSLDLINVDIIVTTILLMKQNFFRELALNRNSN